MKKKEIKSKEIYSIPPPPSNYIVASLHCFLKCMQTVLFNISFGILGVKKNSCPGKGYIHISLRFSGCFTRVFIATGKGAAKFCEASGDLINICKASERFPRIPVC